MKQAAMIAAAILAVALVGAAVWFYAPDKPRAALQTAYAGPPSAFVEAAGARLHVRDTGPKDAPAVLLLHGFGASLHTWEGWARLLEAAGFRVVRLDLPGFGLTGPDPTGDYTDERTVRVLAALMDGLGLRRASVVGSSMGGRMAWFFAATAPERVDKLVLMAPDGFAGPGREYGKAPRVPVAARLLPFVLPERPLRTMLARAYGDPSVLTEEVFARYRDMLLAPGVRRAIVARVGQSVLADPVPLLRRVRAPTLLVWGEKDALVPVSNAADYAQALPDSALVTFPDLGHVPQEEAPVRSLEPVRAFLER